MRVPRMFAAFLVYLSETASTGPTPAGMAGLRHKQRHKTTQGSGPPPVPSTRIVEPPARQLGKAAWSRLGFRTARIRIDGCKLMGTSKRG
jgi:hypothetical protein